MAGLIKHLVRVVRGQASYLTKHYDPVTNELWGRTQLLPKGYPQDLFKQLIVASSAVIDTLVGINQGKRLLFAVDCRTIDAEGYHKLYLLLLGYFVFQLMLINPKVKQYYLLSLALVCGESEQQRKLLQRLRRAQDLLPRRDRGSPNLTCGGEVWDSINQVLKLSDQPKSDPAGFGGFTILAGSALTAALRKVRHAPEVWSLTADLDSRIQGELDKHAGYIRSLFADFRIDREKGTF